MAMIVKVEVMRSEVLQKPSNAEELGRPAPFWYGPHYPSTRIMPTGPLDYLVGSAGITMDVGGSAVATGPVDIVLVADDNAVAS